MTWKILPDEPITNYTSHMKFYKVSMPQRQWNELPIGQHRKYKKWAWETCGGSWAITAPTKNWNGGDCFVYFYIGFEDGADKMGLILAHDPEPVTLIERQLKVFVREWTDK
jgi:hypothetical protein